MGFFDRFVDAVKVNDNEYEEDDYYDDEDEYEEDDEELEDEKPKKGFFSRLFGKRDDDDYDDEDDDDESDVSSFSKSFKSTQSTKSISASSRVTPIRKRSGKGMEVRVVKPSNMEDTREIADTLLANCTVVLNLEGLDVEIAQRVIDFSSGACYTINGSLQKVSSYIFILTPQSVGISGDITDILNGSVPSMRNNL